MEEREKPSDQPTNDKQDGGHEDGLYSPSPPVSPRVEPERQTELTGSSHVTSVLSSRCEYRDDKTA